MVTFGVTYYPDLWPEDSWDETFAQIRKSGFTLIRFGEMSWDWVEPQPGKFDFSGMDKAIRLAHKNKLSVLLGTAVAQAPHWLIQKYPEVRPVADDGTLYPAYGPRPNACRDNPDYQRLAKRLTQAIVRRYKKNPAIWGWQIDNEPTYPPLDVASFKDYCHCGATAKAFQKFAKEKYKTLKELNRAWGTAFWTNRFGSFSEIRPPEMGTWDAGNPHIFLDWYRFKSVQLAAWLQQLRKTVRAIDSKRPVGTNGYIGIAPRVPDHHALAKDLDWYGWDIYPMGGGNTWKELAMMADWWRSVCMSRGASFHVTELQGGRNVRWGNDQYVHGPEIRTWTHQCVAHGAEVILYHAWRTPRFGNESGGFGILDFSGKRTPRLEAIEQAIQEVQAVSKAGHRFVSVPKKKSEQHSAAIVYLRNSDVGTFQDQGPPRQVVGQWAPTRTDIGILYAQKSIQGAHTALLGVENPAQILSEAELEADALNCKVLLLPNPYMISDIAFQAIQNFVKHGGTLMTEARFGLRDANGFLSDPPLIEKLLKIRYLYTETLDGKVPLQHAPVLATLWRDVVECSDGVMAHYTDGHPAWIEQPVGKGRVIYATFALFASALLPENHTLLGWIRKHLTPSPMGIEASDHVEITRSPDRHALYVINHAEEKGRAVLSFGRKKVAIQNILTGQMVAGMAGTYTLHLASREVQVLSIKEEGV